MIKRFTCTAVFLLFASYGERASMAQSAAGVYVMAHTTTGAIQEEVIRQVEAGLLQAGVRILDEEQWMSADGAPVVLVDVGRKEFSLRLEVPDPAGTYHTVWVRTAAASHFKPDTLAPFIKGLGEWLVAGPPVPAQKKGSEFARSPRTGDPG